MSALAPFIVAGIVAGAIYGLAATGLVLSYKTSGIFNFGQGALATAGAYSFYALYTHGLSWELAAVLTVFVVGPLIGLLLEVVARHLTPQRTVWKVVGTVGIISLVQGVGSAVYGPSTIPVPQFLPGGTRTFRVFGTDIPYSQAGIVVLTILIVIGLQLLFKRTRLGVAMRAVVEDPDLADLQGTDPVRIRRFSWVISSVFATLAGVLLLPVIGLDPVLYTFLFLQTFAAAAIGLFSSIPLTYAGGLLVGIATSVVTKYEFPHPVIAGLDQALPFIILIAIMLASPKRKLLPLTAHENRPRLEWHGPARLRLIAYVVVLAFLVSVPAWASPQLLVPFWAIAVVTILWMLSLGLLVHNAGLISLCTLTFAAIGAVASAHFDVSLGVPWILAIFLAGLVAVPIGALVALPGIRLSGTFLALSTLGFGVLVEYLFYSRTWMFGQLSVGLTAPRPSWAGSDKEYYYLLLAFAVLGVAAIVLINRSRLGRMLTGMSESARAVSTLGLNVNLTRVIVFSIAAFIAAVGGALYGPVFGATVSGDYTPLQSLVLVATMCVMPFRAPWYAIMGGVTQVIPGYVSGNLTPDIMAAFFGFNAILVAMQGGTPQMPDRLRRFFDEKFKRKPAPAQPAEYRDPGPRSVAPVPARHPSKATAATDGLVVRDLTVRFGGLTAVSGASLHVPRGRVTALIGPNGAGKTTIFNACSGLVKPASGSIHLDGRDLNGLPPHARARRGLGRTFQIMELCESLTVVDNVALGREAGQAGSKPWTQLTASRSDLRARDAAVQEALALCDLQGIAGTQAGSLSTGQRRRVEFARCLAGNFDILLLDEPSSGLGPDETQQFGEVLRRVVEERDCGILLVEHDVSLVMGVCDYIYVVDFGKSIFDGEPDAVRTSTVVQAAYLGSSQPQSTAETGTKTGMD
jgi:ABC-type branched-subunit amino acid transport system ATPase component/branched-subunit amino acid ABC-type transport system permease component